MSIQAEAIKLSEHALREGRQFVTLRRGPVNSRQTGALIVEVTDEHLAEMARVFAERVESDPVVIDWQHASNSQASPDVSGALGRIVSVDVVDGALVVTPEYTERGARIVAEADGVLWSSPEIHVGDCFDRSGGERIGGAQLLAVTLTPRPQQTASTIDAVRLAEFDNDASEAAQGGGLMTPEEIATLTAERDELLAKVAEMAAEAEARLEAMVDEEEVDKMTESVVAELTEAHNTTVVTLTERVAELEAAAHTATVDAWVSKLLSEGRVTPADVQVARDAYGIESIRKHFELREPIIDLGVSGDIGNGASMTPDAALTAIKLHLSEGMSSADIRATHPELLTLAGLEGSK